MDACRTSPLLMIWADRPQQNPGWGHDKLTNLRVEPVLERMATHGAAEVTRPMIVQEYLQRRIASLQEHA